MWAWVRTPLAVAFNLFYAPTATSSPLRFHSGNRELHRGCGWRVMDLLLFVVRRVYRYIIHVFSRWTWVRFDSLLFFCFLAKKYTWKQKYGFLPYRLSACPLLRKLKSQATSIEKKENKICNRNLNHHQQSRHPQTHDIFAPFVHLDRSIENQRVD